jgi:hypothetical protein
MKQQLWHVAWATLGQWPPHDRRGDWAQLAQFYAPLISAGTVLPSRPLPVQYVVQATGMAILLSKGDSEFLREELSTLTRGGGDRIAGSHPVLAAAFQPTQAHVLLRCQHKTLGQVIGRIKSRLASRLLCQPAWSKCDVGIWGRGYWAAQLLDESLKGRAKEFVESLDPYRGMVRESERPAYFHPEDLSVEALEAEFNSGDGDRIYYAFLNAAYFHEAEWVQAKSLEALASPIAKARSGGLDALQILAAVRKELDPLVVVPAVTPHTHDSDEWVRDRAKDVLADIKAFFGQ